MATELRARTGSLFSSSWSLLGLVHFYPGQIWFFVSRQTDMEGRVNAGSMMGRRVGHMPEPHSRGPRRDVSEWPRASSCGCGWIPRALKALDWAVLHQSYGVKICMVVLVYRGRYISEIHWIDASTRKTRLWSCNYTGRFWGCLYNHTPKAKLVVSAGSRALIRSAM